MNHLLLALSTIRKEKVSISKLRRIYPRSLGTRYPKLSNQFFLDKWNKNHSYLKVGEILTCIPISWDEQDFPPIDQESEDSETLIQTSDLNTNTTPLLQSPGHNSSETKLETEEEKPSCQLSPQQADLDAIVQTSLVINSLLDIPSTSAQITTLPSLIQKQKSQVRFADMNDNNPQNNEGGGNDAPVRGPNPVNPIIRIKCERGDLQIPNFFNGRCPLLTPIAIKASLGYYKYPEFSAYQKLLLTSLGVPRFSTPSDVYDSRMIQGKLLMASWRLDALQSFSKVRQATLFVGELAAPFLPTTCHMGRDEALIQARNIIDHANTAGLIKKYCPRLVTEEYLAIPTEESETEMTRNGLPAQYPFTSEQILGLSAELIVRYLDICANYAESTNDDSVGLSSLVTLIVAICKQGTISPAFLDKVNNATKSDLGKDLKINPECISSVWSAYGQYINENNVGRLMKYLMEVLMPTATRLRIIVKQDQYHSLIAFYTIGRSMIIYPDFRWDFVEKLSPGELARYRRAIEDVGNNVYYGYRKDLGTLKSKNFRALKYAAKELLIKMNGETHLKNNIVFQRPPPRSNLIDKAIELYIGCFKIKLNTDDFSATVMTEQVSQLLEIVTAQTEMFNY